MAELGDVFDQFYAALPDERKFAPTTLAPDQGGPFLAWQQRTGYRPTPDYDLAGAFAAGMEPTMIQHADGKKYPHLGSVGLGGKMLKAPTHETAWKASLGEMLYQMGQKGRSFPWKEVGEDRMRAADMLRALGGDGP